MLVSKLLVAALPASAAMALPSIGGRDILQGQLNETRCVHGSPAKYDKWTFNYEEVALPSKDDLNGYILDPAWVVLHENVGDTLHFFIGSSWIPWGENKCQYTCNAMEGCVSFVGYQTQHATQDNGELYCHFFDALIRSESIGPRSVNGPYKITHAYNKLCDQRSAI